MIPGINRLFEHQDRKYRIECEDLGMPAGAFEIRVADGGSLLWQKRVPYGEGVDPSQPTWERELRSKMEKTIQTVEAAIAKGKIGG